MPSLIAIWIVRAAEAYLALGLVFCVLFHWKGLTRIDPTARDGSWGFRVLISPGVIALWPFLARRWRSGQGTPPTEATPHKRLAGTVAPATSPEPPR